MERCMKQQDTGAILREQLARFAGKISPKETGYVLEVGDGIVRAGGLENCKLNELVRFDDGTQALAMNLEEYFVSLVVLGSDASIREGDQVSRTGQVVQAGVGPELLGRVVNALGQPADGKGEISYQAFLPLESPAPGILDRAAVNRPLHTGIKAVDSMIPIGKGQRELIIGDRQTGKTTLAMDTIMHQKGKNVICIYVAIGQKNALVSRLVNRLQEQGAMDYSIIVSAPASQPAALQYLAPYTGCAIGEFFMRQGKDVLVVYDDLSRHAVAYRELSLLIRRPPGREAYPGDVFYLHSRLLERAAQLSAEKGGGSMTALPVIETQGGDVSAYIPTNVISITDGQIFLETELFHSGVVPAVNPGISVSRVGGAAQIPAMKKVAGSLKLLYAQYLDLKSFARFGSELDQDTKRRLAQGERIVEVLKQPEGHPLSVAQQILILYGAVHDLFREIPLDKMIEFEQGLYSYAQNSAVLKQIAETGRIEQEESLKELIEDYVRQFLQEESWKTGTQSKIG